MMGKTACICLLATVAVFVAGAGPTAPPVGEVSPWADPPDQSITVFFTGNELGAMKPCGCSGGQFGGLDRRDAVFNAVLPENRLILDTGFLVPESTEQNLIKFNVIAQAFGQLGYDVVNLTEQDITLARQAGLLEGIGSLFNCITGSPPQDVNMPAKFTKQFSIDGQPLAITIGVADSESGFEELFDRQPQSHATVNILILNKQNPSLVETASKSPVIDCILAPPQSDEPTLINNVSARPLIITQGRIGKYVGKIKITLPAQSTRPLLSFSSVAVTEDLPQNQALVSLYRDYQQIVKQANLLGKHPRFVLPDNLEYIGSKSCKLCHDYEYKKWMTSPPVILPGVAPAKGRHANAFATLADVNSDYDPECVVCHVVGMQYETGFVTPEQTPQLKNVGCENCHGPGSEHVRSLGAVETSAPMQRAVTAQTCTDCHTAEHSADHLANEKQYNEKVIHWRPSPVLRKQPSQKTPKTNIAK